MKLTNKAGRALGLPGAFLSLVVEPGETIEITQTQLEEFKGNATVNRWLNSGTLQLGDVPPAPAHGPVIEDEVEWREPENTADVPDYVPEDGVYVHHLGGGFYEVWVNQFKVTDENVRGKPAAEAIAAEYAQPEG